MKTEDLIHIELVGCNSQPLIGSDHPQLAGNKYGFEGGSAIKVGETYHLFTAEMAGDPFWVTMRLGHWRSTDLRKWDRVNTLFESKGEGRQGTDSFYPYQVGSEWYTLLYTAREKTQMFWSVGLVFVRVVRVT
jgi:hypothetical protein